MKFFYMVPFQKLENDFFIFKWKYVCSFLEQGCSTSWLNTSIFDVNGSIITIVKRI